MKIKSDKELLTKLLVVRQNELKALHNVVLHQSHSDSYSEMATKISIIREIKVDIKKLENLISKC